MADRFFQIHLDQILKEKAPLLAQKLPGFMVKLLAKIIHQEDLNQTLQYIGNASGVEAMQKVMEYFNLTVRLEGEENIPSTGKYIFVSNHPLGALDGICLSAVLGQKYNHNIKYIVNDILYFLKPFQPIFIPVNKHGSQSKRYAALINEACVSDNQLITFPAGLCSRKKKGKIEDALWKKMFILKAVEYQRDVVPIFFEGRNSRFFYWLANTRTKLGIKANLEMLFLPAEVFKQKSATFTIHFGKPISWKMFDAANTPQEWANHIKNIAYQLEKNK
ncbi:MAG: 1-acyl-sn-glycerol-3-phosphate acyltransferase [Dysgonamonadaceae bacterium]|jgi:putative hemolysin|nr:1-acyl-sn-glycerol-3-phosphate acyltransferase [Dysgonamonadaceae bacterium]